MPIMEELVAVSSSNIKVAVRALGFTVKHRHLRRVCVKGAQARIQTRPF